METGFEFSIPERKSKEISLAEAGKIMASKKRVSITGSQVLNTPMALIRELIRSGANGLTVIPSIDAGISVDLLIAAGVIDTLYVSYVGFETQGLAPAFRTAAQKKSINIIEADEPFIVLGCRAAAGGMPFIPIKGVYEPTALAELNSQLKRVIDPFTGDEMFAIPPLKSDLCIVHAQEVDQYGNAQLWGGNGQEYDRVSAADYVIVSAERIISVDQTRKYPEKVTLPGHMVNAVVHAPYGAHPTISPYNYIEDRKHLDLYVDLVKNGRHEEYLERFVYQAKTQADYLAQVGLQDILALQRMV